MRKFATREDQLEQQEEAAAAATARRVTHILAAPRDTWVRMVAAACAAHPHPQAATPTQAMVAKAAQAQGMRLIQFPNSGVLMCARDWAWAAANGYTILEG